MLNYYLIPIYDPFPKIDKLWFPFNATLLSIIDALDA